VQKTLRAWLAPAVLLALCLGGCITVQVVDDRTNLPLGGAILQYTGKGMEGQHVLGRTDMSGQAEFYVPDDLDTLTVSKPGYETWERTNVWVVQNTSRDWAPVVIRLVKN